MDNKRQLTDHIVSGDQAVQLKIEVIDEPDANGVNYRYDITGFDTDKNPAATTADGYKSSFGRLPVIFQNGPIKEAGVNGVTSEALLAICIDRLRAFQAGPFACAENDRALDHIQRGLQHLQTRTVARIARGVEGTHEK